MKPLKLSTYKINPLTMILLSEKDEFGHTYSRILEEDGQFIVAKSPSQLIEEACERFGSNLEGRQEGTTLVSGYVHKPPISIDPYNGLYFFPTVSPSLDTCDWISHTHVSKIITETERGTELLFTNNQIVLIDISKRTLKNQILRTAQYRHMLNQRIKQSLKHQQFPAINSKFFL